MNRFAGILFYMLCVILSGCAESAFQKALQINTQSAYEQYLDQYPKSSPYSEQARQRIMDLAFEEAQKQDTISAYEAFLKQYPESPYAEAAYFAIAQKQDTVEGYEAFLKRYPAGDQTPAAQDRIEALRFDHAKQQDTIEAYEAFLSRYPEGERASQANTRLEILWYDKARKEDTIFSHEAFLEKYPTSVFTSEIKKRLAELKIPLQIHTTPKFSRFDIHYEEMNASEAKMGKTSSQKSAAGPRPCIVNPEQSHVQGIIETKALVYGKETARASISVTGIKSVMVDGQAQYFLICSHGKLIRQGEKSPAKAYKGRAVGNHRSNYTVEYHDGIMTLCADRKNQIILLPLIFDKAPCRLRVDKDAVPLPSLPKILRPKF